MNILKFKKTKADGGGLIYHTESGDPIFNVHKNSNGMYVAEWHPAMKEIHGEEKMNAHSFYSFKRDKRAFSPTVLPKIMSKYYDKLSNDYHPADPLKTTLVDETDDGNVEKTKTYHVFSDKDEHVATMRINDLDGVYIDIPKEHLPSWRMHTSDGYRQSNNTPTGSGYSDPVTALNDVKNWLPNRDKRPSFIGSHSFDNTKVFTTHLSDEDAAKKYAEHLSATGPSNRRVVNTEQLAANNYKVHVMLPSSGLQIEHNIVAKDGILTHTENRNLAKIHYDSKELTQIIP